jgi:hypothetical protein
MSRKTKKNPRQSNSPRPTSRPLDLLYRSADPFETRDVTRCIGGPAPAAAATMSPSLNGSHPINQPASPISPLNASPNITRSPGSARHPLARLLQKLNFRFPHESQPDFSKSKPGSHDEKPADGPIYPTDARTDADLTMRMAFEQGITAWADESGINNVTLPLEGRFTDVLLSSVSVRSWLARLNFTHSARLLSHSATNQCLLVLQGEALFHPPRPHTEDTAMSAITSDAVGISLMAHVSAAGRFEGPLVELDKLLKPQAETLRRHLSGPRTPERAYPLSLSHLSGRLRKLDSALRAVGLQVTLTRRAAGTWCVVEPTSDFETSAPASHSVPATQQASPPPAETTPADLSAASSPTCLHSLTDDPTTTYVASAGNAGKFKTRSADSGSLHLSTPESTHTTPQVPPSHCT